MQILALRFNRLELHLDLSGALWLPGERVLAVADLHLEKGSSYARRGQMLPPYDSALTLRRLQTAVTRFRPRMLIALGDSFHDRNAAERLSPADAAVVRRLAEAVDLVWVGGNHDPLPPAHLGGRGVAEIAIGGLTFRHEAARDLPAGPEISGHYHPVAALSVRGVGFRQRCFALGGRRLVLPAFGAYAGGLNVLDAAFTALFPGGFEVAALGKEKLHRLLPERLRMDPQLPAGRANGL
ncbi:MAG: ligase-associated DNA damage response endonuclease PdeM [Reyranellaceae bacterium]